MVRAALAKRLARGDTAATASSVEITDEDLRSSGAETDLSPPAEAEAEAAPVADDELEKTLAEVRESLGAAQETLLSERGGKQKPSPSEFEFKALTLESSLHEHIEEAHAEDVGAANAQELGGAPGLRRSEAHQRAAHVAQEDRRTEHSERVAADGASHAQEAREERVAEAQADAASVRDTLRSTAIDRHVAGDFSSQRERSHETRVREEEHVDALGARIATRTSHATATARAATEEAAEESSAERSDDARVEASVRSAAATHRSESSDAWQHETHASSADGATRTQHVATTHSAVVAQEVHEERSETRRVFKVDAGALAEQRLQAVHRTSSEESQRSLSQDESTAKSPEDTTTSSASSAPGRLPAATLASAAASAPLPQPPSLVGAPLGAGPLAQVVLRRGPGSSLRAGHDRRSAAADLESAWSSSGESHYHSFEQTSESGRSYSRPCSSDVEMLLAAAGSGGGGTAGSSEYESALTSLTSQEVSARSTDFHTAVSSFSSRDSMKSLDSESSGHLASVEVSSEASETLVPSALELERDMEEVEAVLEPYDTHIPTAVICGERPLGDAPARPHAHHAYHAHHRQAHRARAHRRGGHSPPDDDDDDEDDELDDGRSSPFELLDGGDDVEEGARSVAGLKRSHEMIFQPEPHPLAADSPESEGSLPDERLLASSLEDGSVASMASVRTVLEASPRATSPVHQPQVVMAGEKSTADSGTSTAASGRPGAPLASVTITTSSVAEHGVQSVCTQVTSQARTTQGHSNGPTQVDFVPEYDLEGGDSLEGSSPAPSAPTPPRRPGHRRSESRAPAPVAATPKVPPPAPSARSSHDDRVECDLEGGMSAKEATRRSDERKDVDEAEPESYHTEADQGFHRDLRERRAAEAAAACILREDDLDEVEREVQRAALLDQEEEDDDEEELPELDASRPQSQVSKSDSEGHRPISSGFSDDRPDSELAELLKQCSGEGGRLGEDEEDDLEDPIERPPSPEPSELPDEPCSPAATTTTTTTAVAQRSGGARDVAEAEAVFRGVGRGVVHASPGHGTTPPIPEDLEPPTPPPVPPAAEALPPRASPIPDITVTQHMTPLVDRSFHYPDLELEEQETAAATGTAQAQTPASASSRASSATDTDQGREYVLGEEDGDDYISEEPELVELTRSVDMSADMTASAVSADMTVSTDLTSTEASAEERTVYEAGFEPSPSHERRQPSSEQSPPGSASPGSDSFELVEKPDLTDDYVVIEEVGREADEEDTEGKSVRIGGGVGGGGASGAMRARGRSAPHAAPARDEEEEPLAQSPPQPQTRLTRVAYYPDAPHAVDDLGPFPFEDSPPTGGEASSAPAATGYPPQPNVRHAGVRTAPVEPDPEVEAGKKWIEMQFQAEHAAALAYGYDMEFERGPLEDIKEEEANDLDQSSGRVGSMGSYQTSIGSFGSVKESFSSTPEYDVLAGRRFFTRSGEHDDVSMSSLQEFEQLERQLAMENARKRSHGSQDSLNGTGSSSGGRSAGSGSGSGSFGARAAAHAAAAQHLYSRSGQGDDVSLSSLKEFEGLESACIEAVRIETQARQEEAALLSEIEEGHESQQISECESYGDSASAGAAPPVAGESADSEDYERRMFEIDEIIRQAQCNVERFADTHERLEASADSLLQQQQQQQSPPAAPTHWRDAGDDATRTSSDSLDEAAAQGPSSDSAKRGSTDSLDQRTVADRSGDIMTTSADSIECQLGASSGLDPLTDSIELPPDAGGGVMEASADSLDLAGPAPTSGAADSIEEEDDDEREASQPHASSSSGRDGDLSSSGAELLAELRAQPPRADYMLGSTDSLEPSSSTATHATYQYETDSVMSGSFTSGGSNTMVSSTDTLDPAGAAALDAADLLAAATRAGAGAWFEDAPGGGGQAFVTEVIEPSADPDFAYTVRRTVELPPEVHSVTFRGPDGERALRDYVQRFAPGEDVAETTEESADGSVHVKRVVQRRVVVRAEDASPELLAAARHRPSADCDPHDAPDPRSHPSSSSSAEAASHRTSAPRHASPVVETQGPGLTTAPRLTEDEDDATLLPAEGGGRSAASSSTTTSTTTTVRDVDGSVVTTVTRLTEEHTSGDFGSGAADSRPQ